MLVDVCVCVEKRYRRMFVYAVDVYVYIEFASMVTICVVSGHLMSYIEKKSRTDFGKERMLRECPVDACERELEEFVLDWFWFGLVWFQGGGVW